MKVFRVIIIITLLSLYSFTVAGQIVHTSNTGMEEWFQTDVTTISEFIERFNNSVENKENLPAKQQTKGLLSLFNRSSDFILAKQDTVINFVDNMLREKRTLSFSDSSWYADVLSVIKYKGMQKDIRLILKTELVDKGIYRWAICGINGLTEAGVIIPTSFGFIEPIDNELNFIGMDSRLQKDYQNAFGYKSADSKISQLSIFLYLLQDHQITIEFVDKIKYHFLNIPGYVLILEHNTTPMNSGWLISDISVLSDNEKEAYEKDLFGDY